MLRGDTGKCLVCEEGKIQHPCKLCRAYLYCSKGCSKKDTKKHKQNCSAVALFLAQKSRDGELASTEVLPLIQKHMCYIVGAQATASEEGRAESRASARSVLSGAGLAAKAKKPDLKRGVQHQQDAVSTAAKDLAAAVKERDEALAATAAARRAVADARGGLAGAAGETRNLKPACYGDSRYWEQRHAKSREGGETYEWYTGYPEEALREAFPRSVRDKKMLVVGCGNSELSEKMCDDGFRDVLSIDTSESAIQQMSARASRFNTTQTSCRYQVMDAGRLDALGDETFGGVVDKGTLDAVLSGAVEPARRICREAMRVLEPGGTFLVISNTPAHKLRGPLVGMCGPRSTAASPSIAVPAAGGACVYAHFIRKKDSPGQGNGASSVPGQANGAAAEHLGRSNESGAASAARARTARPAAAAAPRSDSQVSELEPPAEPRKPSDAHDGCDDDRPGRSGEAGGLPYSGALHERRPDDSLEEKARQWETERDRETRRLREALFADTVADLAQPHPLEVETGRTPPAGRAPLPRSVTDEQLLALAEDLLDLRAETDRQPAAGGAPLPSLVPLVEVTKELGGPVSEEKSNKEYEKVLHQLEKARLSAIKQEQQQQQLLLQKLQLQQQASQPVVPEQQPSLPWGSQDSFSEDTLGGIAYELKFDTELSPSRLSVEIGASRIKASYRRQSGDYDYEVLLDRELHDKVTAESTWCIEDKKIITFILCKRAPRTWGRVFKSVAEPPSVVRRGGTAQTKANGGSSTRAIGSKQEWPAATGGGPSKPPVPSPPSVPRKHERSPKAGLVAGHDFKTPERFLVEDHVGIKKLQLHLSKPQGFRVTSFHVARAGPESCEVRFACRDETGSGLPDARFLQRAHLGRADFSAELASCTGETAADGLCVVGVPYGTGDRGEVDRAGRVDADDEGVRLVARLRCRFCRHPFTPAGRGLAVRAMPSGRWDECIEDMICYDGPRAVPALARDVNFARPGRCLMSQVEVLLHPRDVVAGAVAVVDVGPAAAASGGEFGMPAEPGEGLGWRSLECARCDLPLGRLATLPDGLHGESEIESGGVANEQERGLLLLKHCVLGDDVSDLVRDDDDGPHSDGGDGAESSAKGEGSVGLAGTTVGLSCPPPPCVFRNRTAIKWLMGEMSHFNDRDGCARFILSARGRSPAAPGGALTLVLVKMDGLVSTSGGSKPCRAHRVAFREESRQEAERRDEEERRDEATSDFGSPPPEVAAGGGDDGEERAAAASRKMMMKTVAKVPARLLEVSYAEYRGVRERLLMTAWAGASSRRLDPRGFTFSYLF